MQRSTGNVSTTKSCQERTCWHIVQSRKHRHCSHVCKYEQWRMSVIRNIINPGPYMARCWEVRVDWYSQLSVLRERRELEWECVRERGRERECVLEWECVCGIKESGRGSEGKREISGGVEGWVVSEIDGLLELKSKLIIQLISSSIFQLITSIS